MSGAIDKARDDRADINQVTGWLAEQRDLAGWTNRRIDDAFGFSGMAGHWTAAPRLKIAQVPKWEQWLQLRELIGFGDEMDAEVWRLNGRKGTPGEAWDQREIVERRTDGAGNGSVVGLGSARSMATEFAVTAAATDAARQWAGWGTALKPSQEMWWLVRKPLSGTVAANVQEHGTGALNITATRVQMSDEDRAFIVKTARPNSAGQAHIGGVMNRPNAPTVNVHEAGRWPSNVLLSHAVRCDDEGCDPAWCPVAELDQQSGTSRSTQGGPREGRKGDGWRTTHTGAEYADEGGASRYFPTFRWEAKAPASERPMVGGKAHETVKPIMLMRWMSRLVCVPGGTILDCFAGSGTTGQAARAEGMKAILIEQEAEHIDKIRARLDARPKTTAAEAAIPDDGPMDLLDLLAGEAS